MDLARLLFYYYWEWGGVCVEGDLD